MSTHIPHMSQNRHYISGTHTIAHTILCRKALFYNVLLLCGTCMLRVDCKNYVLHSKTWQSQCHIHQKSVLNNNTQHEICRQWTHNKPILHWHMDAWQVLLDPKDPLLQNKKIKISAGETAQYTHSSYTTSVHLPQILQKLTNINLAIKVVKTIFIFNNKMYAFVEMHSVPVVHFITISTVMNLIDKSVVLSWHMISHGDIPWYAKWAIDILKKQIIQSVDDYDDVSIRVYCSEQHKNDPNTVHI